jgi:GR25 family glycosyltransferase involved in LPS biosynthesis
MNLVTESYISFVNMDHRKDRLDLMQQTLARVGVPAVRTRGMLPTEWPGDPKRVEVMRKRTPGAIGCHMSQVAIMEEALRQQKHAWVMEDDLIFCADFQERLRYMAEFLDVCEWDVLWLGATFHVNPPYWHKMGLARDAEQTDDIRMMRTYGAFCTYAYIVNKSSLARVLKMLDEQLDATIGIDYSFIQMQPRLRCFAFVPGSIIQYDNKSDIGKGMTIFSGFKKLGPYWFQQSMTEFNPHSFNWHEARRR